MKTVVLHSVSLAKHVAFSALFAALCCIASMLIVVPLPNGYFNTGDVFVLLSGWFLGPIYGSFAAAIGSALADLLSGYALYAPVTFVVKGVDALLAYTVWSFLKKICGEKMPNLFSRAVSALVGEFCMVFGYFLFECVLYGFGGATASLVGNVLQGGCCGVCALLLVCVLYPLKTIKTLFPNLRK